MSVVDQETYSSEQVYLTASILGLIPPLAFAAISIGAGAGAGAGHPSASAAAAAAAASGHSSGMGAPGSPPPLALPRFTTVLLLTALSGLVGGASASASTALMADALPCGADGQPRNASRDMLLLSLGPTLPGIVLPAPLGRLLSTVDHQVRGQGYTAFFLCGACCSALSVLALQQVVVVLQTNPHRWQLVRGRQQMRPSSRASRSKGRHRRGVQGCATSSVSQAARMSRLSSSGGSGSRLRSLVSQVGMTG